MERPIYPISYPGLDHPNNPRTDAEFLFAFTQEAYEGLEEGNYEEVFEEYWMKVPRIGGGTVNISRDIYEDVVANNEKDKAYYSFIEKHKIDVDKVREEYQRALKADASLSA